jgi:excisionase family DNA binding protein
MGKNSSLRNRALSATTIIDRHDKPLLVDAPISSCKLIFENSIEGKATEGSDQEWLAVPEAARYLRISEGSLRNLTSNGKIPYYKLGRRVRYLKAELKTLLLSNRKGAFYGN